MFVSHPWSGIARVSALGRTETLDLYASDSGNARLDPRASAKSADPVGAHRRRARRPVLRNRHRGPALRGRAPARARTVPRRRGPGRSIRVGALGAPACARLGRLPARVLAGDVDGGLDRSVVAARVWRVPEQPPRLAHLVHGADHLDLAFACGDCAGPDRLARPRGRGASLRAGALGRPGQSSRGGVCAVRALSGERGTGGLDLERHSLLDRAARAHTPKLLAVARAPEAWRKSGSRRLALAATVFAVCAFRHNGPLLVALFVPVIAWLAPRPARGWATGCVATALCTYALIVQPLLGLAGVKPAAPWFKGAVAIHQVAALFKSDAALDPEDRAVFERAMPAAHWKPARPTATAPPICSTRPNSTETSSQRTSIASAAPGCGAPRQTRR